MIPLTGFQGVGVFASRAHFCASCFSYTNICGWKGESAFFTSTSSPINYLCIVISYHQKGISYMNISTMEFLTYLLFTVILLHVFFSRQIVVSTGKIGIG